MFEEIEHIRKRRRIAEKYKESYWNVEEDNEKSDRKKVEWFT